MQERMISMPDYLARRLDDSIANPDRLGDARSQARLGQEPSEIQPLLGYEEYEVGSVAPTGDNQFPLFPLVDCRTALRVMLLVRNGQDVDQTLDLIGSLNGADDYRRNIFVIKGPKLVKSNGTETFHWGPDDDFYPWITVRWRRGIDADEPTTSLPSSGRMALWAYIQRRI